MIDSTKPLVRFALGAALATSATAQFEFGGEVSTAIGGQSVRLADLDGDGDPDVVVGDGEGRLTWLRNLGGGAFSDVQRIESFGMSVFEVQVGDVDGDGFEDIVALPDPGDPEVILFRGLGAGAFGPGVVQGTPYVGSPSGSPVVTSVLGDIDQDGDLDLLHGASPGGVRLQRFEGGAFLPATDLFGTGRVLDLELADLDGDGDLDLVVLDRGSGTMVVLRVYLNGSGGFFGLPVVLWSSAGTTLGTVFRTGLTVGDVDGDGRPDLLASSGNGPSPGQRAVWCRNLGGGAFAAAVALEGTQQVTDIELMDVEDDGDSDVVLVRDVPSAGFELVLLRNGGGGALGAPEILHPANFGWTIAAADLDGDGFEDITSSGGLREPVWTRNPAGALPFGDLISMAPQPVGLKAQFAADVDNDGRLDVVHENTSGTPALWSRGLGAGQFGSFRVLTPELEALPFPRGIELADVTGDGLVDVLATSDTPTTFFLSRVSLFPGLAAGGFGPAQVVADDLQGIAEFMEVADLDDDGDMDIVVGDGPWILEGLGAGQFGPAVTVDLGTNNPVVPEGMVLDDFDGDRTLDLVVRDRHAGSVRFMRGLGGVSFAAGIELFPLAGFSPEAVGIDLEADGDRDLVWYRDGFVRAWVNDGAASPATEQLVLPVNNVEDLVVHDLDTDGDEDLLLRRRGAGLGVARVDGGIVTSLVNYVPDQVVTIPRNVAVFDADEDGAPDVLISASTGSSLITVEWLRSIIGPTVGDRGCLDAVPNSTGEAGVLFATGSAVLTDNDLTLRGRSLPPGEFSLLIAARASGAPVPLANSEGVLCLRGPIGRFNGPGEVFQTSGVGTWAMDVDLTALPTPTAVVPAMAGETWHFQLYHRDRDGGPFRSNTTTTASVTF